MNKEELRFLFNEYLKRDFRNDEWIVHGNKNYDSFKNELLNCPEYLELGVKDGAKIAILLSGHIRKNSIFNGIQTLMKNMDYDVFVHTWDNFGIKGSETNINDKVNIQGVEKEIKKFNNIKNFKIENNKSWIESNPVGSNYFNFSSPEIFIKSQLYSINQSFKLMEDYCNTNNTKYDIIIKFRFDSNLIHFNLTKDTLNSVLNHKIIFTPNRDCDHHHMDYGTSCWACDNMYYQHNLSSVHIFEHTNVICDLFAYGNMESMSKYCNLYYHYDDMNQLFFDENKSQLEKHSDNLVFENGNYNLKGHKGHVDSLYYFNCSYPERLLQKFLRDYMLVESKDIKVKLVR